MRIILIILLGLCSPLWSAQPPVTLFEVRPNITLPPQLWSEWYLRHFIDAEEKDILVDFLECHKELIRLHEHYKMQQQKRQKSTDVDPRSVFLKYEALSYVDTVNHYCQKYKQYRDLEADLEICAITCGPFHHQKIQAYAQLRAMIAIPPRDITQQFYEKEAENITEITDKVIEEVKKVSIPSLVHKLGHAKIIQKVWIPPWRK